MKTMKLSRLGLPALFVIVPGLAVLAGMVRTWKVQASPLQEEFVNGKLPAKLDGVYKGSVAGINTTWRGKKFNSSESTGINIFEDADGINEKYPFKTYSGKGLQDEIQALKIDYNLAENPLWLRCIVDELVETSPNKYLGKLNVKLVPGVPFCLGFFKLEK